MAEVNFMAMSKTKKILSLVLLGVLLSLGIGQDMDPLAVVNRGVGGAQIAHVSHYAHRIILPYRPRAVVLYAGVDDLIWG
jgi:hypothetical protein